MRLPSPASPTASDVLVAAGAGVVAGILATMAKGQAEAWFQPLAEKVWPPTATEKRLPGADVAGHPDNMPPAEIAQGAVEAVRRHTSADPEDDAVETVSESLHWSTGIGFAVLYAVASQSVPRIGLGLGIPAGLGLYASTHGSGLPLVGLQPWPWQMPASAVAWEAGSHVVYGAVLETVLRVADHYVR